MPIERERLFRPDVIHQHLTAFALPERIGAVRPKLTHWARTIEPARQLVTESMTLARQLSDLVNEAYGLTPDEVNLLWDTAPPRMPISDPRGVGQS